MTRTEAISLLREYIEKKIVLLIWFQQIKPHLKAIVFYGSTAKGLNKPDSDLDIFIILPLDIETKYTKGEYFYKYKNREINIVLRSVERLRKLGEEKDSAFEAEVFRNCEILSESDAEVRQIIEKISLVRNEF